MHAVSNIHDELIYLGNLKSHSFLPELVKSCFYSTHNTKANYLAKNYYATSYSTVVLHVGILKIMDFSYQIIVALYLLCNV